jgi:4-nitrophenyl phosphatase
VNWVLDLDGVVWLADVAIAGSPEAIGTLHSRGERVVFLTNNSSQPVAGYVAKLRGMGIEAEPNDVITSAEAAALLVEPGETALVCAGAGVVEALEARAVHVVRSGPADAVVVGWHLDFDYEGLTAATNAVLGGARLIGTNDDATYPTPSGVLPGGGAILAAVAYASSATPTVAGKPNAPMAELVHQRVGSVDVLVGDRPSTDGLMARVLGARFAFVRSGVTAEPPTDPAADLVAADLAEVVTRLST